MSAYGTVTRFHSPIEMALDLMAGGFRHFTVVLPEPVATDPLTNEDVLRFADQDSACGLTNLTCMYSCAPSLDPSDI